MKNIGKPKYGVLDNGLFGVRIISGIVTGIRYTEDKPVYELTFGDNKWWTSEIFDETYDLHKALKLAPLSRMEETFKLKIKYNIVQDFSHTVVEEESNIEDCTFYDEAQGRHKCFNIENKSTKCKGVCNLFRKKI